jgi:hypothetical protein
MFYQIGSWLSKLVYFKLQQNACKFCVPILLNIGEIDSLFEILTISLLYTIFLSALKWSSLQQEDINLLHIFMEKTISISLCI